MGRQSAETERGQRMPPKAALVGKAIILSACATMTYHPYDEETRTGHLDRRVGDTSFYVEFLGDRTRVGMDAARRYVKRRCAEVALAHHKRFFTLSEEHGDYHSSVYRHDEPGHASCYGTGFGRVGTAQCALSHGTVRYERRADRVRFRALCEIADRAASSKSRNARAHLGAGPAK